MFSSGNSLYISLFLTTIAISAFSYASTTPAIKIYPQTLIKSGDSVRISWSGIESPSDIDWLAIYNPPNSSDSNFIGYVFLSKCENWSSGSCSIDLPLINLRSNYEFRIFRWNGSEVDRETVDEDHNPLPGTRHLLARSEELGFANFNDPAQIHLSFTENEGEMRVLFLTKDGLKSWIKYGADEDEIDQIVETKAMTYGRSDMCDSPANSDVGWRDPGFVHDGIMRNLKPGKRYYYQVGSNSGGWSEVYSFISRDGDSDRTIAFLFGDMGTSVPYHTFLRTQEESISTVKWILRDIEELGHKPSFISHIGDISYARGYSWLWDSFFTQIEPIASKVPYHVCIGNHEYDWPLQPWKPSWAPYGKDGGGECGVPYSLKFNMPGNSSASTGNGSPATRNLYYSFNSGVVHFLYLSTETNFLPGSDQYEFIKHDLETLDREKTPFVVVQGHRPMYTTSNEPKDALLREKMLEHLEPLLIKNSVNLVLWGHVHRYERFCPLRNYTCASLDPIPNAGYSLPTHVVIGMGGQDWQPSWEPTSDHPTDPVFPQPERSVYRGGEFGYVRLVATRTKLTLTYVGNHDGNAHDTVDILLKKEITAADSTFDVSSSVMKSVSLLVFGAFLGYVGGYVYRARREAAQKRNWVAVKTDEV